MDVLDDFSYPWNQNSGSILLKIRSCQQSNSRNWNVYWVSVLPLSLLAPPFSSLFVSLPPFIYTNRDSGVHVSDGGV